MPLAASGASLLAVVPALVGMAIGGWLRMHSLGSELIWRALARA